MRIVFSLTYPKFEDKRNITIIGQKRMIFVEFIKMLYEMFEVVC